MHHKNNDYAVSNMTIVWHKYIFSWGLLCFSHYSFLPWVPYMWSGLVPKTRTWPINREYFMESAGVRYSRTSC